MRPLKTYDDWKHCITVLCGIPLTSDFVARRLQELRDVGDSRTRQFVGSWGEPHRKQVIAWFEQAQHELSRNAAQQ